MEHRVITDYTNVNVQNSNVKVYVRARPPAGKQGAISEQTSEASNSDNFEYLEEDPRKLVMKDLGNHFGETVYLFDHVFWTDTQQEEVFKTVCEPQVDHLLNGFNCCCFAYGQTGSGKTYSMFGEPDKGANKAGLIPRTVQHLFRVIGQRSQRVKVMVSLMEIYCDQIRDLGKAYMKLLDGVPDEMKTSHIFEKIKTARAPGNIYRAPDLQALDASLVREYESMNYEIHEDASGQVFVRNLAEIPVGSLSEVNAIIQNGLRLRATHETRLNQVSSRSHTVFTIKLEQVDTFHEQRLKGVFHLVDLAGSERLKKTESEGLRLKEALHINTSLTALGKVVMALDPTSERTHVPYRDSKLTRVLQNSLGGNSHTSLLATIHPISIFLEECWGTLQFANRCRCVQNAPRVNRSENSPGKHAGKHKIQHLMDEITALKATLQRTGPSGDIGGMLKNVTVSHATDHATKTVVQVLNSLGLQAQLLANGSIQLEDGRIVNSQELDASGSGFLMDGPGFLLSQEGTGEGAQGGSPAGPRDQHRNSTSSTHKAMISEEYLRHLQMEKSIVKQKNKELQRDYDKAMKKIGDEQKRRQADKTRFHRLEQAHKNKVYEAEKKLADLEQTLADRHKSEVSDLLKHNENILHKHFKTMQKSSDNFKVNSSLVKTTEELKESIRAEEKQHQKKQMKVLERNWKVEVENLKQQNDYWMDLRTKEAEKFIEDFSRYRESNIKKMEEYRKEMLDMWEYGTAMKAVMDGIISGLYPIQQRGMRSVPLVPPGHLPKDIFEEQTKLLMTREFVRKQTQKEKALQRVEERTTKALFGSGPQSQVLELTDPIVTRRLTQQESANMLRASLGLSNSRPQSATSLRKDRVHVSSAQGFLQESKRTSLGNTRPMSGQSNRRTLMNNSSAQTLMGRQTLFSANARLETSPSHRSESLHYPEDGFGSRKPSNFDSLSDAEESHDKSLEMGSRELTTDISAMTKKDLQKTVENLRSYIKNQMSEQVQNQVIAELSSHPTVSYIKNLEEERDKCHSQMQDLSKQLTSLRVAYNALQRSQKKGNLSSNSTNSMKRVSSAKFGRSSNSSILGRGKS